VTENAEKNAAKTADALLMSKNTVSARHTIKTPHLHTKAIVVLHAMSDKIKPIALEVKSNTLKSMGIAPDSLMETEVILKHQMISPSISVGKNALI